MLKKKIQTAKAFTFRFQHSRHLLSLTSLRTDVGGSHGGGGMAMGILTWDIVLVKCV